QSGSSGYLTVLCTACAPSAANRWTGSQNRGTYSNPDYDRLHAQALAALNPERRDALLVEIESLITHDLAVGYVIHDTAPMVARGQPEEPDFRGNRPPYCNVIVGHAKISLYTADRHIQEPPPEQLRGAPRMAITATSAEMTRAVDVFTRREVPFEGPELYEPP